MLADIRLQLARYAQGIHWVQKNFLLDESISALLVTAGPTGMPGGSPSSQAAHVVLQMQPDFDVPFPAPESWNQQVLRPTCSTCLHQTVACSHLLLPHAALCCVVHFYSGSLGRVSSCSPSCQGQLTCMHHCILPCY